MEFNSEIKFRRCLNNESDMRLIFDWSNDDEVRKNSFSSEKIKFEDHQRWFQKKIDEVGYYILFFSRALSFEFFLKKTSESL